MGENHRLGLYDALIRYVSQFWREDRWMRQCSWRRNVVMVELQMVWDREMMFCRGRGSSFGTGFDVQLLLQQGSIVFVLAWAWLA